MRNGLPWWLHVIFTFGTLTSWTAVLVAGFSTSDRWPHFGWVGDLERFLLFLASAAITRAAITNHETRLQISCWAVGALVFETARHWMAGRSNGVFGWCCCVAGAVFGAICARQIAHHLHWNGNW